MITVRTSTVESFRLFSDPDCDWISPEEMDARIVRGQDDGDPCSPAAALGTAFHAAVEGKHVGPWLFDPTSIALARSGLDSAWSEVAGDVVIDVDGTPVRITGHADWLLGLDGLDVKTSTKPIPHDRHADSMQWRCYCLIFGCERFVYRQVQLAERDDGSFYAKLIDDVVVYPYPRMLDDVRACLRALLDYARTRGLLDAMEVDA